MPEALCSRTIRYGGRGPHRGNKARQQQLSVHRFMPERAMHMGKGILLWLLGVPLPIIILLALFWH